MSVPFNPHHGLVMVEAHVWGPTGDSRVQLALDTGATTTLIRTAILVLIGYDPGAAPDRLQMTTGSGIEYVPRLTLNQLEALGQRRTAFPALAHSLPPTASIDGLLGLDFMRGQRLTVDFRRGQIGLR